MRSSFSVSIRAHYIPGYFAGDCHGEMTCNSDSCTSNDHAFLYKKEEGRFIRLAPARPVPVDERR